MRVGFIGLGNLGYRLANNLVVSNIETLIYDLKRDLGKNLEEKGAVWMDSPQRVAESSDICITCLPNPNVVSNVLESSDGLLKGLGPGKLWIEMSTTDSEEIIRLGRLAERKGAKVIEAPVSGGCHRASTGNISILVGGDRNAFELALPILKIIGHKIIHVGEIGKASVLKVVTNFLASTHLVALGEALMVCKKSGLDLERAFEGIKASFAALKNRDNAQKLSTEENDLPINYVGYALLILIIPVFLLYLNIVESIGIAALLAIVMMVFGFLFSAVAAYMAGVVGSSNNPVSGVTIATILFTSLLLLALLGTGSGVGAASAIMVGAVVCCAAAIGGDNLQDLKAGNILGATPWKQQIMQIIGTLSSALVLGLVLDILHTAYTIGSPTLSAPQATLMKSVSDGVFTGNLPWNFVFIGGFIAIALILIDLRQEKIGSEFRVPVLAVAVGIYLPITLTVPIFIGGMINHLGKKAETKH